MRLQLLVSGAAIAVLPMLVGSAWASELTSVQSTNPKTPGFAAPNVLSPELHEVIVAQGSMRL